VRSGTSARGLELHKLIDNVGFPRTCSGKRSRKFANFVAECSSNLGTGPNKPSAAMQALCVYTCCRKIQNAVLILELV